MKKSVRATSILLAMLMASAALSGCSQSTGSESSNSSESSPSSETQEITNVKWVLPGDAQEGMPEVMAAINEKIKDQGVSLELQLEPYGSYNDKMNMMISSQEEFDVCFTTGGWLNLYLPNVSKGAFVDITDMIDAQAPELKETIPDFLFDQTKVNGRVYAVPNYQICYSSNGIQVKTDILEKYNFDLSTVKTYEDLEPLLQQITEGEAGYYPVCWEVGTLDYNNDYIVVDESAGLKIGFKKDDPEMKLSFLEDMDKQINALANDWWSKGYIRADKATVVDDTADRTSGKYLTYVGCTIKPGGEAERSTQTDGSEYTQVALTQPFINGTAARSAMSAVSSSSKNPEAAVKMIGIINSDVEVFNMLNYGLEDRDYTLNDEGKVVKKDDATFFLSAGWAIGNQFNAYLLEGQEDGVWEETDRINREADVSPISGFTFDQSNVSSEIAKISAVKEEYKNLAFFDNWEEQYAEFSDKIRTAGLDTYIAELQEQLDAWSAENQ